MPTPSNRDTRAPRTDSTPAAAATGQWRIHENRDELIAKTAYAIAQSRGFLPGHEIDDWLAAEAMVNDRLAGEGRAY
jgi:hypothetical protein